MCQEHLCVPSAFLHHMEHGPDLLRPVGPECRMTFRKEAPLKSRVSLHHSSYEGYNSDFDSLGLSSLHRGPYELESILWANYGLNKLG